ncbi:hypothetical protein [Salinibacter sp. 10B]|uniref:hypothetical protein n=1 Tax=Salinibacter sp. 10B TaxID=1923971 RepID=UPI0011AFE1B4|nr:hypothetical protein [Salinibacter sp. 10B]
MSDFSAPLPLSWCVRRFVSVVFLLSACLLFRMPVAYGQKDYEEWREKQRQQYEQYMNEQDKAFLKFLQKQWTDVEVDGRIGSPIDDKPEEIPSVGGARTPSSSEQASEANPPEPPTAPRQVRASASESAENVRQSVSKEPKADEEQQSRPAPTPPTSTPASERAEARESTNRSQASLSFFGTQTTVPYSSSLVPAVEGAPGKEAIGSFWKSMASEEYTPTLEVLQQRRDQLGLSDWGYYVYIRNLGDQLYQQKGLRSGSNEATLWTWFMMMKSGYSVRVGYRDSNIFLMLPVEEKIFNRSQLHINGQRYYLMGEAGEGALRTYEGQHETADRVLTLDEAVLPNLETASQRRSVSFSYDDERYTIEFQYNPSVVEYLRAYPNVELAVLFRSGMSATAERSLANALRPHIQDRSSRDALNFLLSFVQFATKYKRDRDNFGEERFLFPEESLAESASDCEDRAVLFAYLVRTLLDRSIVGVKWPGHVATAVQQGGGLEATSNDRTLTVKGETYILADPTYIGSSIGMEMPFVEGKKPEVLSF